MTAPLCSEGSRWGVLVVMRCFILSRRASQVLVAWGLVART
jgi:hypothetical protein